MLIQISPVWCHVGWSKTTYPIHDGQNTQNTAINEAVFHNKKMQTETNTLNLGKTLKKLGAGRGELAEIVSFL